MTTSGWSLNRDYNERGLLLCWLDSEQKQVIVNLNGHTLTVGNEGIEYSTQWGGWFRGAGKITSSSDYLHLTFTCKVPWQTLGEIESVIADNGWRRIGLRLTGGSNYPQTILLSGSQSNTFSGDTVVSGKNLTLALAKKNGAIAVRGNIFVNSGASLRFDGSNQLRKTSQIALNNGTISFSDSNTGLVSNSFNKLYVTNHGTLDFSDHRKAQIFIFLDDLVVYSGSELSIKGWEEGRTRLLVKRSSDNLEDSLSRIKFEGYTPSKKQLISYDKDYWEISALPEPATYGAILGAAGLGLWAWRTRGQRGQHRGAAAASAVAEGCCMLSDGGSRP